MSHRHYCPDPATCADRDPCCLYTQGDCPCTYENECRGATPPVYVFEPGVGVVKKKSAERPPAPPQPRRQPRRTSRAQRRSRRAR